MLQIDYEKGACFRAVEPYGNYLVWEIDLAAYAQCTESESAQATVNQSHIAHVFDSNLSAVLDFDQLDIAYCRCRPCIDNRFHIDLFTFSVFFCPCVRRNNSISVFNTKSSVTIVLIDADLP